MNYNCNKIEPILKYYINNGFCHSLKKVAEAAKITKKTLFNRYVSKENLELYVVNYWQIKSNERMAQRMEFANNAVEKLLMFLFELQFCKNNESHLFQKAKDFFLEKFEQNTPHISKLEEIFKVGLEENLFKFDSDPKIYAYYFQFNALFLLVSEKLIYTDYILFLFEPILTESGNKAFRDIDIEHFFKY